MQVPEQPCGGQRLASRSIPDFHFVAVFSLMLCKHHANRHLTSHHSIGAWGLRTHCFVLCGSWESKLRSSPLRDKRLALRYLPSLWPLCGVVVLCLFVCSQAGLRRTEILLLYLQSAGVKDVYHHFRGALELSILLPGVGIIDVHYRACLVYLSLIISLAPSFIAHNVEYTVAYLLFTDCYLGSY